MYGPEQIDVPIVHVHVSPPMGTVWHPFAVCHFCYDARDTATAEKEISVHIRPRGSRPCGRRIHVATQNRRVYYQRGFPTSARSITYALHRCHGDKFSGRCHLGSVLRTARTQQVRCESGYTVSTHCTVSGCLHGRLVLCAEHIFLFECHRIPGGPVLIVICATSFHRHCFSEIGGL